VAEKCANFGTLVDTLSGMATTESQRRRPEVAEGMAAARERGVHVGRPRAPLPVAAARVAELREAGRSLAEIAATLNTEQVPTPSGRGPWTKSSVQKVVEKLAQHRDAE
jgi:DNA invertase Pin-like site-specific DNA recombinase